jgi:prefoldin subunit 5
MSNYVKDYPSLDPLASAAVNDRPANAVRAGDPLNENDVTAAECQYTLRKALKKHGLATDVEVREAKIRKEGLHAENDFASVAPVWAQRLGDQIERLDQRFQDLEKNSQEHQQQMKKSIQDLDKKVDGLEKKMDDLDKKVDEKVEGLEKKVDDLDKNTQQMNKSFQDLEQQVQQMNHGIAYNRACSINENLARNPKGTLIRVPHSTSGLDVPKNVWYPSNKFAIDLAPVADLNALLKFYNQRTDGTVAEKRFRLQYHLGIYPEVPDESVTRDDE